MVPGVNISITLIPLLSRFLSLFFFFYFLSFSLSHFPYLDRILNLVLDSESSFLSLLLIPCAFLFFCSLFLYYYIPRVYIYTHGLGTCSLSLFLPFSNTSL